VAASPPCFLCYTTTMTIEDDDNDIINSHTDETTPGSDELLSDDELRLPESAHMLVRVHAVQAWLSRRLREAALARGEAALALQAAATQAEAESGRVTRRRERERREEQLRRCQQVIAQEQTRIDTYEEARGLLQEYVDHAGGERVLVEFYLALEALEEQETRAAALPSPRLSALAEVQHRVERVGISYETD
ncbi:MAG: hypothetical protein WCD86_26370, partial [Ktedonobacteraceae bacterium]